MMSAHGPVPADFSKLSREELEIRLRQCLNDLRLTKEEARENSLKYMEMVGELGERNVELQSLKDGLEDVLKARNAELMLARERQGDFPTPCLSMPLSLDYELESAFRDIKQLADASGVSISMSISKAASECMSMEGRESLPSVICCLAEGLLHACPSTAKMILKADVSEKANFQIELTIEGSGVDAKALETALKSCEPVGCWDGIPGLLRSLTGWSIKPDFNLHGFKVSFSSQRTSVN